MEAEKYLVRTRALRSQRDVWKQAAVGVLALSGGEADVDVVAGDAAPGVCGEVLHAVDDDRTPQRDHVRVHGHDPRPRRKPGGRHAVRPAPAALLTGAVRSDGTLSYVAVGPHGLIRLRLLPPGLGLKGVVVGHAAQLLQGVVPDRLHVPELRPELSALLLVPRLPCPGMKYLAADTGSGVTGNHIDICLASHEETVAHGVRTAEVWVMHHE